VPPRTAVFSPLSLRGCSRSRCPIVHITPPQRPAGEQPSVDTPAPWDHPDAHGDLQLVYLILSSTSSAPCHVGSKDATIPALPRAAWGTGHRHPSTYAASQARLPGAWWYREATPRAPISPVRRSTPASVRHVYRWSHRPRRGMPPAARGPRRRRPCVWCAHSHIERPVSCWEGRRGKAWWRWPMRTRRDPGGVPKAAALWWAVVPPACHHRLLIPSISS